MGNALPHLMASSISPCKPQPVEFDSAEFAEAHMIQSRVKQKSIQKSTPKPGSKQRTTHISQPSDECVDGYTYTQSTALGSVQNVGIGSTDLIKTPEGNGHTQYIPDQNPMSIDKGWTTNVVDRHDAFYYDQSAIEDTLLQLSMEDTIRIHGQNATATNREGSTTDRNINKSKPSESALYHHEPHFSSDSGSTPYPPEDSYSIIYEESWSPSVSQSASVRLPMSAQIWKCEECQFENNYVSDHCASCYHPTPGTVVEAQVESKSYFKY